MRDVVGVWLGALDGTTWWEQDADEPVLAASLMKVPVAMAAMALDLDREVAVHPDFESVVAGERFELDEEGDQDPDTWAEVGGDRRRCASCGAGRSCSPATSPPTWSWSRPGWPR